MKEFGEFLEAGLSPIPLKEGAKRPAFNQWQKYCKEQPSADTIAEWEKKYDLDHIGLCLGTRVDEKYVLVAIDVDSEDLIDVVWAAVGDRRAPAKIGKKGVTIFCKAEASVRNTKIKRKLENGKAAPHPSIEILADGSQTVVPPSIHPDTGKAYRWVTRGLLDGYPGNLPIITEEVVDELTAICHGKGDKIADLNDMTWLGEGNGGNTHDTCVAAVGLMVSREWSDDAIHARIERAKREACERGGDTYNWPHSTKTIQEWIDSARAKGMEGSSRAKKAPPERLMARWGLDLLGGECNVACVDSVLRHYKDGHWARVDLGWLKKQMLEFSELLKKHEVENAVDIMHTLTNRKGFGRTEGVEARDDVKRQRVCFQNGTFNLRTGEFEKHAPEHELRHQLPFAYNPKATAPRYEAFMREVLKDEKEIALVQEFFALTLVDDMSFQKILYLIGQGGNGKGTCTRLLRAMHSPDAVTSISITALNDERKRTSLIGSMVNISGESSRMSSVADEYFKKITGQDPVDIRRLYGEVDPNVLMTCRFVESANEMPSTSDTTEAMRRRLMIVRFGVNIATPDADLDRKLKAELPGIFNIWAKALRNLYERGKFDPPASSEEEVEQFMLENDTVKMWVLERCDVLDDNDQGSSSGDLYADYREWAQRNGHKYPYASVSWGKRMQSLGFPSKPHRVLGIRVRQLRIKKGLVGAIAI